MKGILHDFASAVETSCLRYCVAFLAGIVPHSRTLGGVQASGPPAHEAF